MKVAAVDDDGRSGWRIPTKDRTWVNDGVPLRAWIRIWNRNPINPSTVRHALAVLLFAGGENASAAVSSDIGHVAGGD